MLCMPSSRCGSAGQDNWELRFLADGLDYWLLIELYFHKLFRIVGATKYKQSKELMILIIIYIT